MAAQQLPSSKAGLRYAVLWHSEMPEPHFDLMIELAPGADLATWRCECWPIQQPIPLTRLKDHRKIYLHYEGQISSGRGRVERVAEGVCQVELSSPSILVVTLPNEIRLILEHLSGDAWQAIP